MSEQTTDEQLEAAQRLIDAMEAGGRDLLGQLEYRRAQVVQLELKVKHLESVNASLLAVQEDDRKIFTRQAAIYIYTAGMRLESDGKMVGFTEKTAWEAARALWDGKPEDC